MALLSHKLSVHSWFLSPNYCNHASTCKYTSNFSTSSLRLFGIYISLITLLYSSDASKWLYFIEQGVDFANGQRLCTHYKLYLFYCKLWKCFLILVFSMLGN